MQVIITTSGVGQRLGDLTKYTSKALIRIGKKPAISYIIESYQEDVEIYHYTWDTLEIMLNNF